MRSEDGGFTAADIRDLYDESALPRPSNIPRVFSDLSKVKFVAKRGTGARWWLTPRGRNESFGLFDDIDVELALMESVAQSGASLGRVTHPIVPPTWAPPAIATHVAEFLKSNPFDINVFAMTRFPTVATTDADQTDPLGTSLDKTRAACADHGLVMHLASDRMIVDDVWENVLAHMWASRYGIAFFEDQADKGINYNLTIEVGGMLLAGRRTALLKDKSVPKMPTDLVGKIYKSVDITRPSSVANAIHEWIRDDLGLGSCNNCPEK